MKNIKLEEIINMELLWLRLTNWRGQSRFIEFSENETRIFAKNKGGKTSTKEAFEWLLTGYTGYKEYNLNLYDQTMPLSPDSPEAKVEAGIKINGNEFVLGRSAKPKFVRPRGSDLYEKAPSDLYMLFIDSIEYSVSDFKSFISNNICDYNYLCYCLSGEHFTSLCSDKWEDARKVLESLIGEINESDFTGDYSELFKQLEKKSLNEIKANCESRKKPIKERMRVLPAIIEDTEKDCAKYSEINFDEIKAKTDAKRKELEEIDDKITGASEALRPLLEQRDKELTIISEKKNNLSQKKRKYDAEYNSVLDEFQRQLNNIEKDNRDIRARNKSKEDVAFDASREHANLSMIIQTLSERRTKLKEAYENENNKIFHADNCSYCGQELPIEQVEKLREQFNKTKKDKCDELLKEGKTNKERYESCLERKEELEKLIEQKPELESELSSEEILSKKQEFVENHTPFELTEEYIIANDEIKTLEENVMVIEQAEISSYRENKRSILNDISSLDKEYGLKVKVAEIADKLETLQKEQKTQGAELAKVEKLEAMIKDYEQERAEITSSKINNNLAICKIDVLKRQKDGTYKPDCVVTDLEGVKLATINRAMHSLINIDIALMFRKHFGVNMPIFVDDSESFDSFNQPQYKGAQVIRLFVSDDEKLKVINS